ncbi:MAG: hypothetical protein AAF221_11150 [Pseudomonadota bacterium]
MKFTPLAAGDMVRLRRAEKRCLAPIRRRVYICLGDHFAYMQSELLIAHILRVHEIALPKGQETQWIRWANFKPKDRLPPWLKPFT